MPPCHPGRFAAVALVLLCASCKQESATKDVPSSISNDEALQAAEEASESAVPLDAEGFRPLRLRDFESFKGEPTTWRTEKGLIETTGKPKGYIYSKKSYTNFTWRGEFRFVPTDVDPAKLDQCNSGFMLCIQEPHKVWPASLEVQGKQIEMASIKSNGGVPDLEINDDPAARETARKPVGEWNSIEIVCKDGVVSSVLNGKAICVSKPGRLRDGRIGLQAENFEVQFRGLRIRED